MMMKVVWCVSVILSTSCVYVLCTLTPTCSRLAWHQNYENKIQVVTAFMWKSACPDSPPPPWLPTLAPIVVQNGQVWPGSDSYARDECQVHVSHFLPGVPCDTKGVGGGIRWGRKRGKRVEAKQVGCLFRLPPSPCQTPLLPPTKIITGCSEFSFQFKLASHLIPISVFLLRLKPNINSFARVAFVAGMLYWIIQQGQRSCCVCCPTSVHTSDPSMFFWHIIAYITFHTQHRRRRKWFD